jgi:TolB-like protein
MKNPRLATTFLALPLALLALAAPALAAAPGKKAADKSPTLAVLYFDYSGKTEEMGLLRKGLAQMLISDLSDLDGVRIVERERLQDVIAELELNQTTKIDKQTAARIGKLLGAKYLVLGGYFDLMGTLRVDARVIETETGRVVRSFGAVGKPEEFLILETKLAGDLHKLLTSDALEDFKARPRTRTGAATPTKRRPKKLTTATAVRYGKALDAKDRGDKEEAKRELEGVLAEAPDFTIAAADLDALMQ